MSSNDTRRSSVRYEPVSNSCTPPPADLRHRLAARMTDDDDDGDDDVSDEERREEADDVTSMDDAMRPEEMRPLNPRRRMSSPVVIEYPARDPYLRRDVSAVLARTNSGTVYSEPRPRMGTRLHAAGASVSSQANSLYKPKVRLVTCT